MNKEELLKKVEKINQECTGDCKNCKYGVKTTSKFFKHCVLDMWENKNLNYNNDEGREVAETCLKFCNEILNNPNIKGIGCEGCAFLILDENGYEKDCKLSIMKEC